MASLSLIDFSLLVVLAGLALTLATSAFWALGVARWARQRLPGGSDVPRVSVIVAARNEESTISACVKSLVAQDYPAERFEIVVVDDHSTDATSHAAERAAADQSVPFHVLQAPECPQGIGPKKNALAFGIEHSAGEILLFTDADCRVPRRWIRALIEHYDTGTGAVGGAVFPFQSAGLGGSLLWLERLLVHYSAAAAIGWGSPASASGGNLSYRRAVYEELGGMACLEVSSGDDDLMVQTIARAGWRVRFASGRDSVVMEERTPDAARHFNAAVRHQSTVPYYRWQWRTLFALSLVSGALTLFTVAAAILHLVPWWYVAALLGLRSVIEGPAAGLLAGRLGMRLTMARLVLGESLLPFYLCWRAVAAVVPRYSWHGRSHRSLAADTVSEAG
jgi:cellulose synthase/poly-beta-1,6-N-acetylglucosamine synthase-like glycosyltransferase